jgi:hypothetical protein
MSQGGFGKGRKNGPVLTGPIMLPPKKPAEKRPRQGTPTKEVSGTDWTGRINNDMEWAKGQIGTAALGFKTNSIANLSQSVADFLTNTLVSIMERNANTVSDLCTELSAAQTENGKLVEELEAVKEELDQAKLGRRKVETKASKKDMEEKVKVAATQFKVMDLDVGGAFTDRKELTEAAKTALQSKVRTDLRASYDEKIRQASIRVLSSKAYKRQGPTGEFWTAPVLVTIPDRDTRWQVEDTLRKSKIFPGFHWPREMVDSVKAYRKVIEDMGFNDQEHYVRIRPEQRDGVWRVRADAKEKETTGTGTGKFVPVASFDLPPMEETLRSANSDWLKPVWVSRFAKTTAQEESSDQITAEDIIMNF